MQNYFALFQVNWVMESLLSVFSDLPLISFSELIEELSVMVVFSVSDVDWIFIVDTESSSDELSEHLI